MIKMGLLGRQLECLLLKCSSSYKIPSEMMKGTQKLPVIIIMYITRTKQIKATTTESKRIKTHQPYS